jgi:hypothetical protein
MTRLMLGVLLSAFVAAPALAATDDELRQMIIGVWGDDESCSGGQLVFTADGHFVSSSFSNPEDKQEGTYSIAGGVLSGTAGGNDMPPVTLTLETGALYMITPDGNRDRLFPCQAVPAPQ